MAWSTYQTVLWLHIFLAIIWVGGLLFVGWGVFPATKALAVRDQRQMLLTLMKSSHRIFTITGTGVIVSGTILGTLLGPIKSWEILWQTSYGNQWLIAFLVGIGTLLWGSTISYRHTIKVLNADHLWILAEKGYKRFLNNSLFILALVAGVEFFGFVILITLMIL